jgi:uncharacterized repeat protein (TIGR03803 family)
MCVPKSVCLALLGALSASSAWAQTILHVFQTSPDGVLVTGNLLYVPGSPDNAIFGVSEFGGDKNNGTIWKYDFTTNTEAVAYSFYKEGNPKGSRPISGLIQKGRFLYGTTFGGYGTFYRIDPTTGLEKRLHLFNDFPGDQISPSPNDQLLYHQGMFYGTLESGGQSHFGSVFGCTLSGSCKILYNFAGGSDGSAPGGQLIYADVVINGVSQPALMGLTSTGGAANLGTVFMLPLSNPSSDIILHSFTGGSDGASPATLLQDGTSLFGATLSGGGSGCAEGQSTGCGTVFSISPNGSDYKVIYAFGGLPQGDGSAPNSLLLHGGALYGATYNGGASQKCDQGCGTVFRLARDGSSEHVMTSFKGGAKGQNPFGVIWHDGTFYGLTESDYGVRPAVPGSLFSIP